MPTPFYHLSVAKELLEHPALSEPVRQFLQQESSAFFFGNTAPDVQTVSRQARADTHFFDLPLKNNVLPPWLLVQKKYPDLADPSRLPSAHSAFLAGYLCHLQADWMWVKEIFVPIFGKKIGWETFSRRLYLHNVLRSYLDKEILPSLTNGIARGLKLTIVTNWLPFVQDMHLINWRDLLAEQLRPGATVKTVEVFAARQGISPDEYYQLISSEERMENEIFTHLSRADLADYRHSLVGENIQLIHTYLENRWASGLI